jgi:bifunctional DNA-binding transcriptional regulator/antitoxin component of YhaV-PrlF toxin-antitoxin module
VGPLKFRRTRISSGHQITIPRVPFCAAGLEVGDRLELTAAGQGRVILERIDPPGDSLPSNGQPQLDLG